LYVDIAYPEREKDLLASKDHERKVGAGAHGVPKCKVEPVAKVATIRVVGNLVAPHGEESERVPWL
jgi:hypothetical protein